VSGGDDFTPAGAAARKLDAVHALLQKHDVPRTIIFCNKLETCRAVENFIARKDRKGDRWAPLAAHAAVSAEARQANLASFLYPPQAGQPARVLICTDRCVVGLSTCTRLSCCQSAFVCVQLGSRAARSLCACDIAGARRVLRCTVSLQASALFAVRLTLFSLQSWDLANVA
jgi:superfamily II DNA/RNA helicase